MTSLNSPFSPAGRGTKIALRPKASSSTVTRRQNNKVYETERIDGIASEKAVLVRVILPGQIVGDEPLDEISGLAETAGARIVSGMIQRRETPDVTAYLGKGKIEE